MAVEQDVESLRRLGQRMKLHMAFVDESALVEAAAARLDALEKALDQVTERATIRTYEWAGGETEEILISLRYALASEKPELAAYLREKASERAAVQKEDQNVE